ncbi:DUF4031 domain-containing protein [Bradyrhizobium sp. JYMT SZCCT0428]|uniref:DUF4031 domain-containing protein n=1 Tax=Bradyrhizobium sp. JYMT SZCCT0428 TaxID=2807673 RepID=UPI001BA7A87D|nr:DUF4031 domain-containing protein [Bradyrhizobium sp. JYMT SZCCT0428]MBR1150109.1 DUF4031 domain-containing protein [Bradyrhizobium sp. JYMT SZCCT0428]
MTVYVDDVQHKFRHMTMCHMWADTLDELLGMARRIGVQAKWLQQPPKASWVHFDISLGKKDLARKYGAVLTDKFGPVEFLAKRDVASGDPERVKYGTAKLAQVEAARALRASA